MKRLLDQKIKIASTSAERKIEKFSISSLEIQILLYLSQGYIYEEISAAMQLSHHTIQKRVDGLRDKLRARDKCHLVSIAFRNGLIR